MTISRINVDFAALHQDMDRTLDEAVDSIRPQLTSVEGHIIAFARTQYQTFVEVGGYGEAMVLDRVIVHYVNYHVSSQGNIHHRPEAAMEFASVESDVHSLVSHYHDEISGVRRVGGMTSTASDPKSEPVKGVGGSEKPSENNHDERNRQN